ARPPRWETRAAAWRPRSVSRACVSCPIRHPVADQMGDVPRVLVVGAGFGGLAVAKALGGEPAQVLVCDRLNYHLFQPLLYQVAMAGLSATDVAMPIRSILQESNTEVLLAEVTGFDLDKRLVQLSD